MASDTKSAPGIEAFVEDIDILGKLIKRPDFHFPISSPMHV